MLQCQKKGHLRKVCRSGASSSMETGTSAAIWPTLAAVMVSVPPSLTKSAAPVTVNGLETKALVDSGSSESFIHPGLSNLLLFAYIRLLALFLWLHLLL